ncbi:Ig-like domain-containing protein, partial [Mesorhizobium japonicum]|uniref:Ig-like domain-containing protein n=1 Tax=Mesorhizobium japonicum TaxID=2066070 RepID=UPI003B5B18CE
ATTISITGISNDTGIAGDFITSSQSFTINGGLSAALAADESVQISLNGSSWVAATLSGDRSSWTYDPQRNDLTTTTVQVRVVDDAGNVGQSATKQ